MRLGTAYSSRKYGAYPETGTGQKTPPRQMCWLSSSYGHSGNSAELPRLRHRHRVDARKPLVLCVTLDGHAFQMSGPSTWAMGRAMHVLYYELGVTEISELHPTATIG